ncbi:alpha/beta-hydrolase [Backusella circina FSU 941]|nr:alpha/beta-hydrolase [Backusella circina FSU 941]
MNRIRLALNKLPPITTIKILRKVFSLPTPAARKILGDITKPRSCHKLWIHKVSWNGVWSGCWIGENVRYLNKDGLLKRINECDLVFFNVHGGGFRIGSSTMFMDTYIGWIRLLKERYNMEVMIMSVDYRLAPEFKYPAPIEDIVKAYEYLLGTLEVAPSRIVVTGDSAGACLIFEMLFITFDPSMFEITDHDNTEMALSRLQRPAGAVFISPLVTDETISESWKANEKYDYISQYTAKVIKRDYLGKKKGKPGQEVLGIAKLTKGFQAFLPEHVLMFVGNKEVLRDDAIELAAKAEKDGVLWETVVEDCVHDWFCVREVVKDKSILTRADATFADFCYRVIRRINRNKRNSFTVHSYTGLESVREDDEYDETSSATATEHKTNIVYV